MSGPEHPDTSSDSKEESFQIHANVIDGNIVITFSRTVSWLRFSPADAKKIGETLISMAQSATPPAEPTGTKQ